MRKITLFVSLLGILLCPTLAVPEVGQWPKSQPTTAYKDLRLLGNALSLLQQVDLLNRDSSIFVYSALAGMIEGFDRFSFFVSPDIVALFLDGLRDEYVGIGIQLARKQDGTAEVVAVDKDSPADRVGIAPKDIVISLNGIPLKNMNSTDIFRLTRGTNNELGTSVRVALIKPGLHTERQLSLVCEHIKVRPVESRILDNKVGYVRIHQFTRSTLDEFKQAVSSLREVGRMANGLILDLRNNPGGEMLPSVDVARMFLNKVIIVSMESNVPEFNATFKSDGSNLINEPLVVIINQGSASGAELVAGAIKFHKRGVLVGQKSFGKGTFQSFIPITNEMGAYLTLGRFKLPDGISPENNGITPDVTLESTSDDDVVIRKALTILSTRRE